MIIVSDLNVQNFTHKGLCKWKEICVKLIGTLDPKQPSWRVICNSRLAGWVVWFPRVVVVWHKAGRETHHRLLSVGETLDNKVTSETSETPKTETQWHEVRATARLMEDCIAATARGRLRAWRAFIRWDKLMYKVMFWPIEKISEKLIILVTAVIREWLEDDKEVS